MPEILFGLQKLMDDPDCEVEDVYLQHLPKNMEALIKGMRP